MSDVPLWVINLARRLHDLCNHSPFVEIRIMKIDDKWYLQTGNRKAEELGK